VCRRGAGEALANDEFDDLALAAREVDVLLAQGCAHAPHHPSATDAMALANSFDGAARDPVLTSQLGCRFALGQLGQDRSLLELGQPGSRCWSAWTSLDARSVETLADGLGIDLELLGDPRDRQTRLKQRGRRRPSRRVRSIGREARSVAGSGQRRLPGTEARQHERRRGYRTRMSPQAIDLGFMAAGATRRPIPINPRRGLAVTVRTHSRRQARRHPTALTGRRTEMGQLIISDNVSFDGVVQDPAGDEGFRHGG
jgi:hypothetical protein